MIQTVSLAPGITLRCIRQSRFKHSCLSLQFVTALEESSAALNALLPTVLLRGCQKAPNIRAVTACLDDNYGSSVSTLVRRVGDIQTTGLYCSFLEDRFAQEGDRVLEEAVSFLLELVLRPVTRDGVFLPEYVEGEKNNLIATIESEMNDKRSYAAAQLRRKMCQGDSFALSRLGTVQQVRAITPAGLHAKYRQLLSTAPVDVFYVGSAQPQEVAQLLQPLAQGRGRVLPRPNQSPFLPKIPSQTVRELMDVTQGKLCMGFVTDIVTGSSLHPAMQILCALYGGASPISKLFVQVREKQSLCYDIGAGYYGTKGILMVSAGVETRNLDRTRREVLRQLELCQKGDITRQELDAAKESYFSSLRALSDSPGSLEGYFGTALLSGGEMDVQAYRESLERVTLEQVVQAAKSLKLHTTYCLEGEEE